MVSHKHKSIFIHIPKTGGMSIEKAFLNSLGLSFHNGQNHSLLLSYNTDPSQGPPSLAHLAASDYVEKSYLTDELFNSYFKFTIVRNPWSRMVSIYKHFDYHRYMTFEKFLEFQLPVLQEKRGYFVMPQVRYIFDDNGNKLVDFIGKFETIQRDFECVRKNISTSVCSLEHINKSPIPHNWYSRWNLKFVGDKLWKSPKVLTHISLTSKQYSNYREYYSSHTKLKVEEIYREDIETFNYSF